ncbi:MULTISPECIES: hypothetical protein [unclassified Haloarcula]|uniref:hypothetical protein n=1 Tax=unclassified Haloarcula TaxID=2624677 RepID=UPI000EF15B66|nr:MULTISPECIES: hypothetical protein [unclassified Haloarcula]RLM34410.1 hypothetical protein DVK01_11900 [Haloarcula sp. Atlit-120R]RLM87884.1 hypothetical protein D3D01_22305 [Haloarcula sp. Atlit-7R]
MADAFETASNLLILIFAVVTLVIITQSLRGGNTASLVNLFVDLAIPLIVIVTLLTILFQFIEEING